MKMRHLTTGDGEKVTEILYTLEEETGWRGPSVARAIGHLTMVEMAEWIEDNRRRWSAGDDKESRDD